MVQRKNHRIRKLLKLLIAVAFTTKTLAQIISIHQINVSQGDACFIKIDTIKFLIDAGNPTKGNNVIIPYLATLGIDKLNFTIASHHHADHIGALDEVIYALNPDMCYDRGETYNSQQFNEYITSAGARRRTLNPKDTIIKIISQNKQITLTCIASSGWIWNTYAGTSDENTLSIALLLEFVSQTGDTFRFFTAGDLYAKQESLIAVKFPKKINLMKISHHGSRSSTSNFMLQTFQPQAVMIPVGDNNPYGHPHPETLAKFENTPSIKYIYQTEQGSRTSTKSIISGNIIANVYDRFFTISTSNNPARIDTFYFGNETTLNAESEPFKRENENNKKDRSAMINSHSENGFTKIQIFIPDEIIQTIQVYNILGQLVHETNIIIPEKFELKIPSTASGVYLVLVKTNKNIYHNKITILK